MRKHASALTLAIDVILVAVVQQRQGSACVLHRHVSASNSTESAMQTFVALAEHLKSLTQ